MSTIDTSQRYDYLHSYYLFALNSKLVVLVDVIKSYTQRGNNNALARPSRINRRVEIGRVATGSRV